MQNDSACRHPRFMRRNSVIEALTVSERGIMEKIVLEAVQWSSLPKINDITPLDDDDYKVLKEIREVLQRHKRTERFGVCLLHKHFEVASDEIAVEYTDEEQRISRVVVENAADNTAQPHIQTMWKFSDGTIYAGQICIQKCVYMKGHGRHHIKVPT